MTDAKSWDRLYRQGLGSIIQCLINVKGVLRILLCFLPCKVSSVAASFVYQRIQCKGAVVMNTYCIHRLKEKFAGVGFISPQQHHIFNCGTLDVDQWN